jgi:hypothetical protein
MMTVVTAPPAQDPSPMTGMMRSDSLVLKLSEDDVVQQEESRTWTGEGSGGNSLSVLSREEGMSESRVWSWGMAESTPEARVGLYIADNHP